MENLRSSAGPRLTRWAWCAAVAFSVAGIYACSTPASESGPKTIGASGGTVEAQGVRLTIPEGALDKDVAITAAATDQAAPAGIQKASPVFAFGPDGLTFLKPVTVEFDLTGTPTGVAVYWSNASGGYDRVGGTVSAGKIAAEVTHFSTGFAGTAADTDGGVVDGDAGSSADGGSTSADAGVVIPPGGGGAENVGVVTGWAFALRVDASDWWVRGKTQIFKGSKTALGAAATVAADNTKMPKECPGLWVDGTAVYWGEEGMASGGTPGTGGGTPYSETLRRLVKGTNVVDAFQTSPYVCRLAGDATHVYWTSGSATASTGSIFRAPLAGGAAQSLVSGESSRFLISLAVDAANVYWSIEPDLRWAPKTGGTAAALGSPASRVTGLLTQGSYVYFGTASGTLQRIPADGSGPAQVLASNVGSGPSSQFELATDGTDLFYAEQGSYSGSTGTIGKLPLAGGTPTVLAKDVNSPQGIAVDSGHVYFVTLGSAGGNSGNGAVWRIAK